MRNLVLAFALGAVAVAGPISSAYAAVTPCETMLKDLRAAEKSSTLKDADKATVSALEAKGIERCNADDDKRADDFFAQALKVMGK